MAKGSAPRDQKRSGLQPPPPPPPTTHLDGLIALLVGEDGREEVPDGELWPQHLLKAEVGVRALQRGTGEGA